MAFGVLLALVPFYILPVCEIGGGMSPMRCHWTGSVLTGFGVFFVVVGTLQLPWRDNGVRIGISVMTVCAAILGGFVPAHLVGMCTSPAMPCRTGTYPAVMILLALIALTGTVNAVFLAYRLRKEQFCHDASINIADRFEEV